MLEPRALSSAGARWSPLPEYPARHQPRLRRRRAADRQQAAGPGRLHPAPRPRARLRLQHHDSLARGQHLTPDRLGQLAQPRRPLGQHRRGGGARPVPRSPQACEQGQDLRPGARGVHVLDAWHLDLQRPDHQPVRPPLALPGGASTPPDPALQLSRGRCPRPVPRLRHDLSGR